MHRTFDERNRSYLIDGSLYAMELALHEWLLDSPLRTLDAAAAHLYFVPIYQSSLFLWPVLKYNDEPYLGRPTRETKRRSHQGTLLMLEALKYIRSNFPYWDSHGGRDHVFMMLHDEGPCFCPRELRSAILLTHYGYHKEVPRPWGTFFDDNFLADANFYRKWIGDPNRPTQCFDGSKDLVIPPWKVLSFQGGVNPVVNTDRQTHTCIHTTHIFIHIYIHICKSIYKYIHTYRVTPPPLSLAIPPWKVLSFSKGLTLWLTRTDRHTHTCIHTHTHIYTYIYIHTKKQKKHS